MLPRFGFWVVNTVNIIIISFNKKINLNKKGLCTNVYHFVR